jgi:hypothetical protein
VIFVHLGQINAISQAQIQPDQTQLPVAVREEVELFSQAVIPSLFSYINDAPLNVVCGLFGILMNGINVQALALTKIGIMILTTMTTRAELLKQAGDAKDEDCDQWYVVLGDQALHADNATGSPCISVYSMHWNLFLRIFSLGRFIPEKMSMYGNS